MKSRGFTLAEVLITLAVIGIVAAMGIPALMNNTSNKQYEVGFKEAYALISQAMIGIKATHGDDIPSLFTDNITIISLMCEHLNCTKTGLIGGDPSTSMGYPAQFPKNFQGGDVGWGANPQWGTYAKLNNGMIFWCSNIFNVGTANMSVSCSVDIDGLKGPYVVGKDIQYMPLDKNGIKFKNTGSNDCDIEGNSVTNGASCGYFIIKDGELPY